MIIINPDSNITKDCFNVSGETWIIRNARRVYVALNIYEWNADGEKTADHNEGNWIKELVSFLPFKTWI